jgi:hypothetical protein
MKKSIVALLIAVGLVGGMFMAGCGGGGEEADTGESMEEAMQKTGEQMEEAAKQMEETAEDMKEEAEGSGTQ